MPRRKPPPHSRDSGADGSTALLFVCLGNICRSPLAEGVFRHLARTVGVEARYHAESAGTGGWHVGASPDPRSVSVARRHGIRLEGVARKVDPTDFSRFNLILAMDADNLHDLRRVRPPEGGAALHLLREFDPAAEGGRDVPDPYYGGERGFEEVFEMIHRSCGALLERLEADRAG